MAEQKFNTKGQGNKGSKIDIDLEGTINAFAPLFL
jgi:hypothetical protein